MPSRFRNLVGSKRKASGNSLTQSPSSNSLFTTSNNNNANTSNNSSSLGPASPVPNNSTQSPPQPASERSSTASNPNTLVQQQQASVSTTSLAMNPHQHPSQQHGSPQPGQQPLGRPPSYQYVNQAGQQQQQLQPQQQQMSGRPTSPMPPPPINTQNPYGRLPPHAPQHMYGQQPVSGPPGYPMQAPPQQQQYGGYVPQQSMVGGQYSYDRGYASEANNQRSKAQLIVGIDFVSIHPLTTAGLHVLTTVFHRVRRSRVSPLPLRQTQKRKKTSLSNGLVLVLRQSKRWVLNRIGDVIQIAELFRVQIPTVLYYDQHQQVVGWGADIADALAPTGYPKPGVQKVEWFKLQLMMSGNTYIDPINLPPLPPGKSEIDVAADYLFKLRQAMRNYLQKTLGEVFTREERNIRYFLTVPAIWNDAGKAATRAAAIQAGFLRDENDNRLTLVTEPEAAAMFCSKTGLLNLKVQDAVLIVDCGGGTVDLIA